MSEHTEELWWWPVETDAKWCEDVRKEYDLPSDWDDETVRDKYNDGLKYSITWDHIGDAYAEYEPMAEYLLKAQVWVNALATPQDTLDTITLSLGPVTSSSHTPIQYTRTAVSNAALAKARDDALEDAAKDITVGYEEFEDFVVVDSLTDAYAISRQQAAKEIRALKGKTNV